MSFGQAGLSFKGSEPGGGGGDLVELARIAAEFFRPQPGPGFQPFPAPSIPRFDLAGTTPAFLDLDPLGPGVGIGCPEVFAKAPAGARAKRLFMVPHPTTGTPTFFGHLGRPLLFTRDVQGARKVRKLASRFARRRGGGGRPTPG